MTPRIGLLALRKAVTEIANADPEHVYCGDKARLYVSTCTYLPSEDHETSEGCLIGQALLKLGVPEETLEKHLTAPIVDLPFLTKAARIWGGIVQGEQDAGLPWGFAVAHANRNYSPEGEA